MTRKHSCAICGRHAHADMLLKSRWTGNRFCVDEKSCVRRAKRRAKQEAVPA